MDHQTINPNQNITNRSGLDRPHKKYEPAKTLEEKRDEQSDNFAQDAKDSARTSYDTENQLSSNLITVTLAFVALISAAVSTSDVLNIITDGQRWTILFSLIIFCLSITAGLVNYFYNMRYHQKIAKINSEISNRIDRASSKKEVESLNQNVPVVQPGGALSRNNLFLIAQIVLMVVGLILVVTFVGTLLFRTK